MIKFETIEKVPHEASTIEEAAKIIGADKGAVIETDAWHGEKVLIAYFYAVDDVDNDYVKYAFAFSAEDSQDSLISTAAQVFATSFTTCVKESTGEYLNTFSGIIVKSCDDKSPESNIIQEYMRMRKENCDDDIPF